MFVNLLFMNLILKNDFYFKALMIWIFFALCVFIILLIFKPSTYGRHFNYNSICINNRLGWFIMELPTVLLMPYFYFSGSLNFNLVTFTFIMLYLMHYINRVFVFPFKINTKGKKIPLLIVLSAMIFNTFNTFFIGYYFGNLSRLYDLEWFYSPCFIIGFLLFLVGAYINYQSDKILINLRKGSETGYKVPFGGLFKYVSCPNHFGEIIEWIGFAILTCSVPAFSFAIWTIANLLPRSIQHHDWYKKKFPDYPVNRKAIIPFLI